MMKTKRKGTTLVEVLVSIAVFSIISIGMLTSFLGMRKTVARQEETLRFSMICRDIAFYGDVYRREWDVSYFGARPLDRNEDGVYVVYYDEDFLPTPTKGRYRLHYYYTEENNLIVSIFHEESGRVIIDELDYGGGRYAS